MNFYYRIVDILMIAMTAVLRSEGCSKQGESKVIDLLAGNVLPPAGEYLITCFAAII